MAKPKKNDETKLTFGQKAVGITFNPSKDPAVDRCKQQYANIIDQLDAMRNESDSATQKALASAAITQAVTAQMWAVKAITAAIPSN